MRQIFTQLKKKQSTLLIKNLLKTRQQVQNEFNYAKPHITKIKLSCLFGFPRNGTLNQSIRNQLISTG